MDDSEKSSADFTETPTDSTSETHKYKNEISDFNEDSSDNLKNSQSYDPNKPINFLDILVQEIPYDYKFKKFRFRKATNEQLSFEIDDSHRFRNNVTFSKSCISTLQTLSGSTRNSSLREFLKKKQLEKDLDNQLKCFLPQPLQDDVRYPIDAVNWENYAHSKVSNEHLSITEYVNNLIQTDWTKHIVYNDNMKAFKDHMTLFVDDPNLIFEKIEEKNKKMKKKTSSKSNSEKNIKSKYNISNDKYYTIETKTKASLDTFGVQHSLPALKLVSIFYKTNHTKEELRNYHKPRIDLKNQDYNFKSISIAKSAISVIKKENELTLADCSPFYIFEYSEENPFYVVNPGMVSLITRYYRKNDPADDFNSEKTIILEPEEEGPFFGFGNINPGSHISTFGNNLFISPVFKHKTKDFLCIINDNEIYMRPIENFFLAGQQFPKEEVFAPHSRKLNQFCKDRLKVAVYRMFLKGKTILMQDLDALFPYFSEGSKRKWLKEYADCVKRGRDNVWLIRDSCAVMSEEDLRKIVTPENICQYESMLATERKMHDLGLKYTEVDEDDYAYEIYSPSWSLSRNFINAVNKRGLLELNSSEINNDENDLTFFSFRRVKLKKGNETENRKILSEHQSTYKERIDKIWNKHINFLSSTDIREFKESEVKQQIESQSETTANDSGFLLIKRAYRINSQTVYRTEKIYDPMVIKGYLKAKKKSKTDDKKATNLTCSNCGQTGHMKTNKSCPSFVNLSKPTKKKNELERRRAKSYLQEIMNRLLSSFVSIPYSNAFHRPVSAKKFPNYSLIIKNPIDFSSIRSNIRNFKYKHFSMFAEDFKLMHDNCKLYNGPSHSLTEISESIYRKVILFGEENSKKINEAEAIIANEEVDSN